MHRHALKKINNQSNAQTISKLTVHSQLLQNYFSPAKLYSVNDEVWPGCPKLGHATLLYTDVYNVINNKTFIPLNNLQCDAIRLVQFRNKRFSRENSS